MGLVLRGKDQGQGALPGKTAEARQHFAMAGELRTIAAAEFGPSLRVMPEPFAELGAWRDVLEPIVELRFRFADSAWPQPINQDAPAILAFGGLVSPLEPDARGGDRAGDGSGHLRKLASQPTEPRVTDRKLEPVVSEQHYRPPA